MLNRLELQKKLEEILGNRNVYFQPPESVRLNYPAIVYDLLNFEISHANDDIYSLKNKYQITVIDRNPESKIPAKILESFKYCGNHRRFVTDNLYHDVFNLYF